MPEHSTLEPPLGEPTAVPRRRSWYAHPAVVLALAAVGLVGGLLIGALIWAGDEDDAETASTTSAEGRDETTSTQPGDPTTTTVDPEDAACLNALTRARSTLESVDDALEAISELDASTLRGALENLQDLEPSLREAQERCADVLDG